MTKDVLVSISGAHMLDSEEGDISVITAGTYYFKNGKHYILYEELVGDVDGVTRNTLKIDGSRIEMIKGGAARSHMVFEPGKTDVSCYVTPFGQMMVSVTTGKIKIKELPDQLKVGIDYMLEINYEKISDCHIEIEISSKAAAKLNLSE